MTQEDCTMAAGSPPSSSKDDGKRAFIESRFSDALGHYLTAINQIILTSSEGASASSEHQILLSNVVACRLKIGGSEMIEKAVEEAKKCVSLNPQWSKAHVRLASAYIALGGFSNDACLSLQRALSLDRTNNVAREMLVKEMRRRTMEQSGASGSSGSSSSSTTTNNSDEVRRQQDFRGDGGQPPTDETSHRSYPDASSPPSPPHSSSESANNNNQSSHDGIDIDDTESPINVQQHNSLSSLSQRIQHYIARFITWFYSQSEDFRTLIMVSFCFLVLYVALGGRFGLGGALPPAGNYGKGNAYDRYSSSRRGSSSSSSNSDRDHYQDGRGGRRSTTSSHSTEYNDRTNPQNDKYYARYGNTDDYYYDPPRGRQNNRGYITSFQLPNLHDGSLISMTILLIGGMICHRFGVSPFQVLMMLNLLNRRGGGARFGYGAYPGGAGGFGRFGGGFGRQRYGFGRRGRGGGYW